MVSQRGVVNLFHSDGQRDAYVRRGNAMRIHGVDAEILDQHSLRDMLPFLNFDNGRFPIMGGLMQRRGGTVRHDAVAWGFARGADMRGVDLIQNCEVTGFQRDASGAVVGVETTRKGFIKAARRWASRWRGTLRPALPRWPGFPCRLRAIVLQAFVSEALQAAGIDTVITFGAGHFYISQSDKGGLVFGGDLDGYNSFAQRGNLPT